MYYSGDDTQKFIKVTVAGPRFVTTLRSLIERGVTIFDSTLNQSIELPRDVYEANITFALRYMVDSSMVGCSWVEGLLDRFE